MNNYYRRLKNQLIVSLKTYKLVLGDNIKKSQCNFLSLSFNLTPNWSKLSLDTRLINYYLPEVNIEGKYACNVQEWPRNKLTNMVLADFTYKIWPRAGFSVPNVFQNWPQNDPYF